MLKKLAILIGMLALAAGTAFAQKVVTLDIDQVLTAFSKTAAIKAEVEADQKDAESLLKIKVDEFQKQREKLTAAQQKLEADRGNPTLSKAAVAKAEEEVKKTLEEAVKMEQDLRRSQQEMRELLQSKFTQKTNVVLQEDIFPRIKEIAKAHGADIVLNARVGILFAEPSVNITEELIERLKKDFPQEEKPAAVSAAEPAK